MTDPLEAKVICGFTSQVNLVRFQKSLCMEYQKTRHSDHPKVYYKDFKGILMTDGLEQYHKIACELDGLQNANCFAHARRHFANAIKAIGKGNQEAIKSSIAYKALVRILHSSPLYNIVINVILKILVLYNI